MKKLSIALALILCLVMVVFCFAACGKKKGDATTADQGTTPEATTAPKVTEPEATEPEATEHQHTQGTEYVIDTPATCGADGSKSYHCTECGDIIPGTEVVIPADPTLHVVNEWTIVAATVIKDGTQTGTCTNCNQLVEKTVAFVPNVYESTSAGSDWKIKKNLTDALDGEHFYPTEANPNGLDYYFEVDFLWNETITTNWIDGDGFRIEMVNADSTRDNLFLFVPKNDKWGSSDAKAPGGFDYGWNANHKIVFGPMGVDGTGTNAENFPNIGEYGWHRIGIKVHQEAAIKGDGVEYSMISTLYLDGIKAWQITFDQGNGKDFSKWLDRGLMLFTATNDNGTLVYSDPSADLCLDFSAYHTAEMTGVYLVTGEAVSLAVDPDFTPEGAAPVADPDPATLEVAEGVVLPAAIYFKDPASGHDHVWTGTVDVTKQATLLEDGVKTEHCAVCNEPREVPYSYEPDIQKFTDATKNSYNPNIAKVSDIRGDEHFYTPGNDLIVEFSVLWTEEIQDLRVDKKPYMDFRFTQTSNPDSTNKNIIYWSLCDNCPDSDCAFAGGFEWGGIDQNEPDNPYPKFTDGALGLGTTRDEYPNIGGANKGDGIPQGEDRYGWHRVSVRYRQEVANVDAVKAGAAAEYKLSLWAYIDGVLVVHSYATDFIYRPGKSDQKDYKLFTAASDGNGGIAYTDINDDLYFSGAYFHYKQMASGKVAYFAIADYSAKIGSEFEQNVAQVNYPVAKQLEVEEGVFVPVTMWYTKPCAEHTWDEDYELVAEPTLISEGTKVDHCSVCGIDRETAIDETDPIVYVSNWDLETRNAHPYTIANPDNSSIKTFGIKKHIEDIQGEGHFYPTAGNDQGNDLLVEFSFLYNATMANAGDGTLTAMYIENNNVFNINMKTGKITAKERTGDFYVYPTPADIAANASLKSVDIGEYGWHRFGMRIHQEAVNNAGNVEYTVTATAYLDGVKIFEVDKTSYALEKHNSQYGATGLLYIATADGEDLTYTDVKPAKFCDVYVMVEELPKSGAAGYLVVGDVSMTCGHDFVQNVEAVADPAADTFEVADGVEVPAAFYYKFAD